jgi:hypothetical protein
MNGAPVTQQHSQSALAASKQPKPPPPGPAPPAPVTAPPLPPTGGPQANATRTNGQQPQHHHHHHHHHQHGPVANGQQPQASSGKKGKRADAPLDPATLYESLKNRIAALEEEEEIEEEEERQISASQFPAEYGMWLNCSLAEEAHRSVRGMEENAIHAKYVELVRFSCSYALPAVIYGDGSLQS